MPEKKLLQTIWINDHWEMYVSEKGRDPSAPETMQLPNKAVIINNENYKKYKERHEANIRAAAQGKDIVEVHDPAYRRNITYTIIAAGITLFAVIVAFMKTAITPNQPGTSLVDDPIALTSFIVGAIGTISTCFLAISIRRAEDKFKREIAHFNNQEELLKRLKSAKDEIQKKDKVLDDIIILLEINDQTRAINGPLTTDQSKLYFRSKLATAIDDKDDIN